MKAAGRVRHPSDTRQNFGIFPVLGKERFLMGVLNWKVLLLQTFGKGGVAGNVNFADYYAEPSEMALHRGPERGRNRSFAVAAKGRFRPPQE